MKYKHLSSADRSHIEVSLNSLKSCSTIANELGKHRTTIAKEILKHRTLEFKKNYKNTGRNICRFVKECDQFYDLDNSCNATCDLFKMKSCPRLERFPYVCNGCTKESRCNVNTHRYYYNSVPAYNSYIITLHESRRGICISKDELAELNRVFHPDILKRQSIKHILSNNPQINRSHQTIYNYINSGILNSIRLDLTRAVKFKTKKERNTIKNRLLSKNPEWLINRTYKDYLRYVEENKCIIFEMDTVIGKRNDSGCLLTLLHCESSLLLIHKLKAKTQKEVRKKISFFYKHLTNRESIGKIDLVLLTDRGVEFLDPTKLEYDPDTGEKILSIFYCDPMCSHQKGKVENSHTLIRRIIPKGKSLEQILQKDCITMMNHINSYKRERLNWSTPYESFSSQHNTYLLYKYKLRKIKPIDVSLNKSILK